MSEKSLTPALLLSMPQLNDPNFGRTVVLLCEYAPEGAFGLVINRPTDFPAASVVQLVPPIAAANELPLWIGGPVEPERGWILLSETRDDDDARDGVPCQRLRENPGEHTQDDQEQQQWPDGLPAKDLELHGRNILYRL